MNMAALEWLADRASGEDVLSTYALQGLAARMEAFAIFLVERKPDKVTRDNLPEVQAWVDSALKFLYITKEQVGAKTMQEGVDKLARMLDEARLKAGQYYLRAEDLRKLAESHRGDQ